METELTPPHIARSLLQLRAAGDNMRPRYHFAPPGGWMNDPNAPLWHQGYYHLFYQHNPYSDTHGKMYWGHCRSEDLLNFEDMSIALKPDSSLNEQGCWSGSGILPYEGSPVLLYTGEPAVPGQHNQQNVALGDHRMRSFTRRIGDVLPLPPFPIREDWRDPFFFRLENRTFVVVAAFREDYGTLLLYEAIDSAMQQYVFRSELFTLPSGSMQFPECPNFFRLGSKWVLLISPYRSVEYWVGTFDDITGTFTPENHGILDSDNQHENGMYATNMLCEPGQCDSPILIGWLRGYPAGRGWSGALSLPRLLELGGVEGTHLIQHPWPLIDMLRRDEFRLQLHTEPKLIFAGLNFELYLSLPDSTATSSCRSGHICRIDFGTPPDPCYRITIDADGLRFGREAKTKYHLINRLSCIHIFRDGMTLEVFLNDGEQVISRTLHPMFDKGIVRLLPNASIDAVLWQLAV